jgi:hypothetical protein
MVFRVRETVYIGNSYESSIANGWINRYVTANGYVEIANSKGTFAAGQIIYGVDSGFSLTLTEFNLKLLDLWDFEDGDYVVQDDGQFVALDAHFTGDDSEQFQTEHLVVL